jgi:hypothetical protein
MNTSRQAADSDRRPDKQNVRNVRPLFANAVAEVLLIGHGSHTNVGQFWKNFPMLMHRESISRNEMGCEAQPQFSGWGCTGRYQNAGSTEVPRGSMPV